MNLDDDRAKFLKIFSNLPDKIRGEDVLVVVDEKPYTWNAAYFEIKNHSETGKKILKKLKELDII